MGHIFQVVIETPESKEDKMGHFVVFLEEETKTYVVCIIPAFRQSEPSLLN